MATRSRPKPETLSMRFTLCRFCFLILLLPVLGWAQGAVNIDLQVKGSRWPAWGTDSGTANAYAVTTVAPLGPTLRTGSKIQFVAQHSNTAASTLAVNGGTAINLVLPPA